MIKTILAAVRGERQETEASPPRGQTVHGWPVGNSNLECHLFLNTEMERSFLAESCPGEEADRKQKGTVGLADIPLLLRSRGTGQTEAGHKPASCIQRQDKDQHKLLQSPSRALRLGCRSNRGKSVLPQTQIPRSNRHPHGPGSPMAVRGHCCQVLEAGQVLRAGLEGGKGSARVNDINFR